MSFLKHSNGDIHGKCRLLSHEECSAKLVDGTLKVTVEVEMEGDRRIVKKTTEIPKSSSQWVLEEMYSNNMKDSDFTLVCEEQKIPCHKIVLTSASPYFRGMMNPTTEQFKEYKEGSVVVQCSEQVGHGFVKFLYTAEIQKTVLEDNYETFLRYGHWAWRIGAVQKKSPVFKRAFPFKRVFWGEKLLGFFVTARFLFVIWSMLNVASPL